jgi:hypothetical protein
MNGNGWTPPAPSETDPRATAPKVTVASAKEASRSRSNGRKIHVKIGTNGSQQ